MIAGVTGRVSAIGLDSAVVDVGGVGLLVQCTPATLARLQVGQPAALATLLVVREDALTLYGFADADERTVFELLLSASGVGPKIAQAALAVLSPDAIRLAIATDDVTALTRVPGVGKKGAQRIVLELKDKVSAAALSAPAGTAQPPAMPGQATGAPWAEQVRAALQGLGYTAREADEAVAAVAPTLDGGDGNGNGDGDREPADVAAVLRSALRTLSRT